MKFEELSSPILKSMKSATNARITRNYNRKPTAVSTAFWSFRCRMRDEDDMLLLDKKVFVSSFLRRKLLTATHYGHQGGQLIVRA